ncbi:hypothetical protein [Edwardsiella piscicida]|uniref:DUF1133 domain-containing protein n=1 Tax=Edwardsiella tarda (strain FL6-60) TaxID=718251 RepID=A0A0H3DV35_EDWTF|nr:hypothetical protein [Edwardsiella piscicida]ADM43363.1 hypothetical protein ETAF_ple047 [Edwardsiella tarda FL6-60]UCQ13968.1 hypothetical protein DCE53_12785 [Edwardsiella piscicida]UCQ40483.1 hypothetical protein DCF38_13275 [Edwardsiella piscicida]WGS76333.1 hypothetical protein PED68_13405 [Edwardsiella piscicida]WGS79722.1 hypothetical protein PED70_13410 [Edwardsiella piscicida]
MTLKNSQKGSASRANKQNAWVTVAGAPRRSYLGKYHRLTPAQSRWVRSLLNQWGGMYGGSGVEHLSGGGGLWSVILTGWTGEQQERIASVLSDLRRMGYSGQALFDHAKAIIWPKKSLSSLIGKAVDEDEAEFMEAVILKSFALSSPVYVIGKDYYTRRNTMNSMARWMQQHYAPFLTEKQCIDRVRWCIELFNSAVYFTLMSELCIENAETCKKDLKTSFEAA